MATSDVNLSNEYLPELLINTNRLNKSVEAVMNQILDARMTDYLQAQFCCPVKIEVVKKVVRKVQEAARQHGLTVAEIEQWKERFPSYQRRSKARGASFSSRYHMLKAEIVRSSSKSGFKAGANAANAYKQASF